MSQTYCPNCNKPVFSYSTICNSCQTPLGQAHSRPAQQPGIVLADGYVLPPPPQVSVSGGVWRDKKRLVMAREATLPNRCVKCNAPTTRRVKRTLTWHHPAYYLLIPAGLLVYAIVAMIVRETVKIEIGLCEDHYSAWRRNIWITTLIVVSGVLSFVAAIAFEEGLLALLGFVLLLAAACFGIAIRLVQPAKIDRQFVWVSKTSKEYLDSLPQWTGY